MQRSGARSSVVLRNSKNKSNHKNVWNLLHVHFLAESICLKQTQPPHAIFAFTDRQFHCTDADEKYEKHRPQNRSTPAHSFSGGVHRSLLHQFLLPDTPKRTRAEKDPLQSRRNMFFLKLRKHASVLENTRQYEKVEYVRKEPIWCTSPQIYSSYYGSEIYATQATSFSQYQIQVA